MTITIEEQARELCDTLFKQFGMNGWQTENDAKFVQQFLRAARADGMDEAADICGARKEDRKSPALASEAEFCEVEIRAAAQKVRGE